MLYPRTLTKRKQVDSLKAVSKRSKPRGLHKKRLKTLAMWLRNKRIKCTTKLNWEGLYVCAKPLQSCQALCDPMDCSPPGSSVHGILHARILEWIAFPYARGSSQSRDWTQVSRIPCTGRRVLYCLNLVPERRGGKGGQSHFWWSNMLFMEHGTTDWFQIGKGVHQGCILSPCWFNLFAEYIMRHARLDEAQAGIKIARRNINKLRYADDITLWQKGKTN